MKADTRVFGVDGGAQVSNSVKRCEWKCGNRVAKGTSFGSARAEIRLEKYQLKRVGNRILVNNGWESTCNSNGFGADIGECCNTEAYVGICEGAVVIDYVMTGGAGSKSGYVCDTGAL